MAWGQSAQIPIDLLPCETVSFTVTTPANPYWGAVFAFDVYNSATPATSIYFDNWSAYASDVRRVPVTPPWFSTIRGTRGVEGLPGSAVLRCGIWGDCAYAITMTKAPRPAYNIGGTSFTDAAPIAPHTVQYGSLHPLEPGQFYTVHLNGHESIYVSGEALGFSSGGSLFSVDLYDSAHQLVKTMVVAGVWGSTAFPSGSPTVFTNPGAAGADYYVKLSCAYSPTHEFNFSVELTGAAATTATELDQVQYYHMDAIGSVRAITDSAAQLVARYDYLPFGDEWLAPPVQDSRLFAGKERDPETDFDYLGARYYSKDVGRFTTVDPGHVGSNADDPQSWNAYAYARNNPLKFVDPNGTEYQICDYDSHKCGTVSDRYFRQIEHNPGAGISLSNGLIFATVEGERVAAGSYRQTSVDPTFESMVQQAGDMAHAGLTEGVERMAKDAVLVGATFGLGLAVRGAAEVVMAARTPNLIFKTATFGQKLIDAGVDVAAAKAAVRHVISSRLGNSAPVGVLIKGTVNVGGRILEFTAMRLPSGEINVGSIRIPR